MSGENKAPTLQSFLRRSVVLPVYHNVSSTWLRKGDRSHSRVRQCLPSATVFAWLAVASVSAIAAAPNQSIEFARDIQPILSSNCFQCHGPDDSTREADLRLDVWEGADDVRGAGDVVARGNAQGSELFVRVTSTEPDLRMPPEDSGKSLTTQQIETLRRWVVEGAPFERHWAFTAPQRPEIPRVQNGGWVRTPVDAFVLASLEREGFSPSPEAGPQKLLRRLSLDLIGLPPTLEEMEAATEGDAAYEREVDRLLGSPHFGERWGRIWLDAARYADSDGFEKDKPRFVWMYRDWVINALNSNMPYDEFIVQQIAGDILPKRSQAERVATGFLRNSMLNEEAGVDPEQFRMEAMYDRMDAIGKAILGLTIQCAQCHSHKYDPLSQTDYYRMFAILNNCFESQMTVYPPSEERQRQAIYAIIQQIEDDLRTNHPDWRHRLEEWENQIRGSQPVWVVVQPRDDRSTDQKHSILEDGSVLAAGYAPTSHTAKFSAEVKLPKITAVRLELMNDDELPRRGPGRSVYGTCALTEFQVAAAYPHAPDWSAPIQFADVLADLNPPEREMEPIFDNRSGERRVTGPIAMATDGDLKTAWGIDIGPGRSNVPRTAVFVFEKPVEAAEGVRLTFSLVQNHGGLNSNDNQNNNLGRFRFSVMSADKPAADPLPYDVRQIVETPPSKRTPEQLSRLFSCWRTTVPEWSEENRRIESLWQSHPRGTTQHVLKERENPRATHRLERGNYLTPAEQVLPGVPGLLHPLPTNSRTPNRMDFAGWLVDRRSPTTARAIINRIWQAYFGVGLSATPEDLGTQGEAPSHPELLDWLAVELMDREWNLKHIHKLIVLSSTYRQSSVVTPKLLGRDPENRVLARGPRFRVDAEIVRDIALVAGGLLNTRIGGPSVHPPAPEFLFQPPASFAPKPWTVETGPDRYRRALYTFRFRSVPYPALQNFDAPNGEVACARRSRSNTPLQALTTLNEPLFVECAQALARNVLSDGGSTDTERIRYAVRRCLAREPDDDEALILQNFLDLQKKRLGEDAKPWSILADEPEGSNRVCAKLPNDATVAELAAWTALSRVILNLDETITKE